MQYLKFGLVFDLNFLHNLDDDEDDDDDDLFCDMVNRRKAFSIISSRGHFQRSSPSWISDTSRAGFEPAQNLSSGFDEWSCAVVITTAPQPHSSDNHT